MDINTINKILQIDDMGSTGIDWGDTCTVGEPPCSNCGAELERTDPPNEYGVWDDTTWACPCCGRTVTARDIDFHLYLDDWRKRELKKEALEMGYVYSEIYHDIHDYDPNDPDDREYHKLYSGEFPGWYPGY